jgi:protein TonB
MKKNTTADLKRNYTLYFQTSLALSLVFILALTKIPMDRGISNDIEPIIYNDHPEVITIPNTDEIKAAPPKPYVPIEVTDDKLIDDIDIQFPDFEFTGNQIALPPRQKNNAEEEIVDSWGLEVMPIMIGGLKALYAELEYPKIAKRAAIEGKVIVQFTVNTLGEVEQPEILRGIGGGCNEEVLRVIKKMKFSPGIQNDRAVKVRMTQTVVFRLTN